MGILQDDPKLPWATTFMSEADDSPQVKVKIVKRIGETQTFKVQFGDDECCRFYVRHKDRITATNDVAKKMLDIEPPASTKV